jgi:hypothetical protein
VLVLMVLAVFLMRRHSVIPFFVAAAVVMPAVAMEVPVISDIFFLMPMYENMHIHSPGRMFWVYPFIPAMLAGAAVNELRRLARMRFRWLLAIVPFLLIVLATRYVERVENITFGTWHWTSIILATLILLVICAVPMVRDADARRSVFTVATAALVAFAFLLPNGVDIVETVRRDDPPPGELVMWGNDPWMQELIHESLRRDDPGGAGEFLQQQRDTQPPFRFIAYGGMYHPETVHRTYPDRRLEPAMVAILQNSRPMRLLLETTQGYNPLQPLIYQDFMQALNGQEQDYHYASLLHTGVASPLLDLLNVRYIVVDRNIPEERDDHRALAEGRVEVYRDDDVIIYKLPTAQPRAWMVYDVRPAGDNGGLAAFANGEVDGGEVAFVDGELPPLSPPVDGSVADVTVTDWTPDGMTLEVDQSGEGLLVVSEVYSESWKATVDGEEVEVLQTNHALLGIPVGPGQHTVEVRYDPDALTLGLWVSGISGLGSIAVLGWAGWHGLTRRTEDHRPTAPRVA